MALAEAFVLPFIHRLEKTALRFRENGKDRPDLPRVRAVLVTVPLVREIGILIQRSNCPHCGTDLERSEQIGAGNLTLVGGARG